MYVLHPDKLRNVQKVLGKRKKVNDGVPGALVQTLAHKIAYERALGRRRLHPSDASRMRFIDRERTLRYGGDPSDASRKLFHAL